MLNYLFRSVLLKRWLAMFTSQLTLKTTVMHENLSFWWNLPFWNQSWWPMWIMDIQWENNFGERGDIGLAIDSQELIRTGTNILILPESFAFWIFGSPFWCLVHQRITLWAVSNVILVYDASCKQWMAVVWILSSTVCLLHYLTC